MKRTLLLLSFLMALLFCNATEYRIPASSNGVLADFIKGTLPLRQNGVKMESSANIVELRFHFIKEIQGKRESFRTETTDTFFFNQTDIWLERNGVLVATYNIATKKVTIAVPEIIANDASFGLVKKQTVACSVQSHSNLHNKNLSNTSTSIATSIQKATTVPVVVIETEQITPSFAEEQKTLSFIDSLSYFPHLFSGGLTMKQIGQVLKLAHEEDGFAFEELPDSILLKIENDNTYFYDALSNVEAMSPLPPLPPIQADSGMTPIKKQPPKEWPHQP